MGQTLLYILKFSQSLIELKVEVQGAWHMFQILAPTQEGWSFNELIVGKFFKERPDTCLLSLKVQL